MGSGETWEIRWIAPRDAASAGLRRATGPLDTRPVLERDVYLLVDREAVNLKVRQRRDTLKLKTRVERDGDGRERWRTDFDVAFPVGRARARAVLDALGVRSSAARLAAAADADEALAAIGAVADPARLVTVDKVRYLSRRPTGSLDRVHLRVLGAEYVSLGMEGDRLDDLRALLAAVRPGGDLGMPRNYVEFLSGLERAGPETP